MFIYYCLQEIRLTTVNNKGSLDGKTAEESWRQTREVGEKAANLDNKTTVLVQ